MGYTYEYPRPAVTSDCVVLTRELKPKVLLIKRGNEPYKDCWAFPGGFMEMKETLEECAVRELKEETNIEISKQLLRMIGMYSTVDRDPRGRVISGAYLVAINKIADVKAQDDAIEIGWFDIDALPPLAFDHEQILKDALDIFY